MDVTPIRDRIAATLDSNADTRRQAELDLKYAEEQPGFIDALLTILQGQEATPIRQSAVVYLKNRVNRGWAPSADGALYKPIPEAEKLNFRNQLLAILAASPSQIRSQLIPILQKILQYDFPEQWPNFMDATMQLLSTEDANSLFAGLQSVLAICRTYRFKSGENREDFNKIVELCFAQVLNIGTRLVEETSIEAGELLRVVMKSFKHAAYFELPAHLIQRDQMLGWCTLFTRVVSKEPPPCAMPADEEERETNHWWKAKKWAYANLNRLFVRYGNPNTMAKSGPDYTDFAKTFINDFAPGILTCYLHEIEKWVAKTAWLSRPSLSYTMGFLDECVKPKSMWTLLKPNIETLLRHVIFPIMCQSDEDIELFEDDPQEYVHRKLNSYEEVSAPDIAATGFLVSLTKNRKKQTYTVLSFVNEIVMRYESAPEGQKNPREKEGALRMISSLSEVLLAKKSPIAHQVEAFFVRYVFPEFRSPHGYLRARACDSLQKFDRLDFSEENNLRFVYRNVLESLTDNELPVRIEAALALQVLVRHDIIRAEMQMNIPQIMQQLLKLANEVDVDSLTNVMEDFVEAFSAELTPFAVALSEQLRDTYLRIIREVLERQKERGEDEEGYGDFMDDKSITALGVLQTIGTLILSLESTPDVLLHLETILMPVIVITLDNNLLDLFNEVFEIIDSCTFSAKSISPTMWQAFEMMHKTFKSGAELYLEGRPFLMEAMRSQLTKLLDMLPALDNFITFGARTMIHTPSYVQAVVSMVEDIFRSPNAGGMDRINGCKLAECVMLNLRGHADQYIPSFIEQAMTAMETDELKVKSYRIHLLEMVINAIYYNPVLAFQVLETRAWTNRFFSAWFSNIDSFSRVHDKKLSILAIAALLTLKSDQIPSTVKSGWAKLFSGAVRLFQTLPTALKNREEVTREDDDFQFNADDDDEDEWEGEGDWTQDADEVEEDVKESSAYLDFLHQLEAKSKVEDKDEDDELEEESMLETPLDKVEPYTAFKHSLLLLQQGDPGLYQESVKHLRPEEVAVIQAVCAQAEALERAAAVSGSPLPVATTNGVPPQ